MKQRIVRRWDDANPTRAADMTEVILGLGVVALVSAALIARLWNPRRGSTSSATTSARGEADPWLTQAAKLTLTGQQLVEHIEPMIETESARRSTESVAGMPTSQLDAFTHNLAELAVSAPTTMDNRVCRSAAVKSYGLSEALRGDSCGSDHASPNAERARLIDLQERLAEFRLALTDLAQHIHLL